jgi:hypothetical protein
VVSANKDSFLKDQLLPVCRSKGGGNRTNKESNHGVAETMEIIHHMESEKE